MKILGIIHGHNSSACLLNGSEIKGCVAEERFDRIKNSRHFPIRAIEYLTNEVAGLKDYNDIDLVVHASYTVPFIFEKSVKAYESEREQKKKIGLKEVAIEAANYVYYKFPPSRKILKKANKMFYINKWTSGELSGVVKEYILEYLKIDPKKIVFADHHTCHAYAVYYGFVPKTARKDPFLVLTLDGEGDGLCATVSIVHDGKWQRISQTEAGSSLAGFYGAVTGFMGMKRDEHEYKVMGLAPYCSPYQRDKTLKKLKGLHWINNDLSFGAIGGMQFTKRWLEENLRYDRFDGVAAAAQKYVEDLAIEWVKKSITKTGIDNIALSGGFFMNIKANKAIMEMPEVNSLYVCPSGGDESTPIGAAYYGMQQLGADPNEVCNSINDLYLGPEYSESDIEKAIAQSNMKDNYTVERHKNIETEIARLLARGIIVARFNDRMEFGARALGNRSILANPSNPAVVRIINEQIKSRDFWMPFACSILEEMANDYLINNKNVDMFYMVMSFDTKPLAREHLIGAIHPYDFTIRPQIVSERTNKSYYKIIRAFESITGIGGILNTSFNLHGDPVVCSPEDALLTFKKSGMTCLAIGNYMITKQ